MSEEPVLKKIKLRDDLSEQEEIALLYKNAFTLHSKNDPESKLMYRGVVHECDNMLKKSSDQTEFELNFYIYYANSLYALSILETVDNEGFLELSFEFIKKGKSKSFFYLYSLAKILLKLSNFVDFKACVDEAGVLVNGTPPPDTLVDIMAKEEDYYQPTYIDMFIELLHLAHEFLEDSSMVKEVAWNIGNWKLIEEKCGIDALIGLGSEYLLLVDLTSSDDDDAILDESHTKDTVDLLKHALENFERASKINESCGHDLAYLYLMIGECKIRIGNLVDHEDEVNQVNPSLSYYTDAVHCFTKVKEIDSDMLPQEFEEFLVDWKKDLNE